LILGSGTVIAIKLYNDIREDRIGMQWYGMKFSVITIIEGIIARNAQGYVVNGVEDTLIIILCDNGNNSLIELAKKIGRQAVEEIWLCFNIKSNVGIGNPYKSLSESSRSKKEALASISISEENGYNQVNCINELDTTSFNWSSYYMDKINYIIDSLFKGDIAYANLEWMQAKEAMIKDNVPVSNIKVIGLWLINFFLLKENEEFGKSDSHP
jgi:hypothetical protein